MSSFVSNKVGVSTPIPVQLLLALAAGSVSGRQNLQVHNVSHGKGRRPRWCCKAYGSCMGSSVPVSRVDSMAALRAFQWPPIRAQWQIASACRADRASVLMSRGAPLQSFTRSSASRAPKSEPAHVPTKGQDLLALRPTGHLKHHIHVHVQQHMRTAYHL